MKERMVIFMEKVKWTVEYTKGLNSRLEAVGLPTLVIDEVNHMVYKDELHKLLGIGVRLEES
jgi:hypothetical protein